MQMRRCEGTRLLLDDVCLAADLLVHIPLTLLSALGHVCPPMQMVYSSSPV